MFPAFSELTEADINKIRLIIKEEIEAAITKSEARTKAYIDASEARTKEYIAQEICKGEYRDLGNGHASDKRN